MCSPRRSEITLNTWTTASLDWREAGADDARQRGNPHRSYRAAPDSGQREAGAVGRRSGIMIWLRVIFCVRRVRVLLRIR